MTDHVKEIATKFQFTGEFISAKPFGEGHINSTFVLNYSDNGISNKYILQEINTDIFTRPDILSKNIRLVTSYLKEQIEKQNGDPLRETLTLIPTLDGTDFYTVDAKSYRAYHFISNAVCYQEATPALFYESAKAFGKFAADLDGFNALQLEDTIPLFHNTPNRYNNFIASVNNNLANRADSISSEIEFIKNREDFCGIILNEIDAGNIPLRTCHNDTKLNNVMMDADTDKGLCVIDLDTVMNGSLLYDFGDSIRFGASSAPEDEKDLSLVYCDLSKYENYVKGYLESCGHILSEKEFELLAEGAILMTLECGMRFLTDHLDGDVYFNIHRENHNLDRARNQFKLVQDMEHKLSEMKSINTKYK